MIALYSSFLKYLVIEHDCNLHLLTPRGNYKAESSKNFCNINILKDLTLDSPQYVYARILSQSVPLSSCIARGTTTMSIRQMTCLSSFFSWCHQRNIWRGLITFVLCLDLMTQAQMWQTLDDKKLSSVIDRRCCEFYW